MRRLTLGAAIGIAVGMASCGMPQPQTPTKGFQTASNRVQNLSSPKWGAERHPGLKWPRCGVWPDFGVLPEAPCTVTGSADILLEPDNPNGQVVHVTVDVADVTGTNPTGTVSVTELIDHNAGFYVESSDITSIVCVANLQASITGNVDDGGAFSLDITPSESGGQLDAFYSPQFRAGGPVANGRFIISGGVGAIGPGRGLLLRCPVPTR